MIPRALVALVLLLVTAIAVAAPSPRHVNWTRAVLDRLPVAKADREPERLALRAKQLDQFAVTIAEASQKRQRPPREYAALLATIGGHETNFDTQLVLGICKPWQCDRGRAKGAFQNHNVRLVADLWPTAAGDIVAQVEMADRVLRRSLTRCAPFAPYPAHVFRAYRGGAANSCSFALKDEQSRVATYFRILATPEPMEAGT